MDKSQRVVEYAIQHGILSYAVKNNGELKNIPSLASHILRSIRRQGVARHVVRHLAEAAGVDMVLDIGGKNEGS